MNRPSKMWCVVVGALAPVPVMAFGQREVQDFNRDWRFIEENVAGRGSIPEDVHAKGRRRSACVLRFRRCNFDSASETS
jgi:hypothetical protein